MKKAFRFASQSLSALAFIWAASAAPAAAQSQQDVILEGVEFNLEDFQVSPDTLSPETRAFLEALRNAEDQPIIYDRQAAEERLTQRYRLGNTCSRFSGVDFDSVFTYQFQEDQRWRVEFIRSEKKLLNVSFMLTSPEQARRQRTDNSRACRDDTRPYQGLLGPVLNPN